MSQTIIADTPEKIAAYRLLALKGALFLETKGMKARGRAASVIVREVLKEAKKKAPANKEKLLECFIAHLRENGILPALPQA